MHDSERELIAASRFYEIHARGLSADFIRQTEPTFGRSPCLSDRWYSKMDSRKRRIEKWFRLTLLGEEYLKMRKHNEYGTAAGVETATRHDANI